MIIEIKILGLILIISAAMRSLLFVFIFIITSTLVFSQSPDTSQFVQYRILGSILLNNQQKIKVWGLTFIGNDSIVLYNKTNINKTGTLIKINGIYQYQPPAISGNMVAIDNIKIFRENKHGLVKGATTGAITGFAVGYIMGFISYQEKFDLSSEEDNDNRKNRAVLFGVGGSATTGLLGALIGNIIIRKSFPINGKKENLTKALNRVKI